MTVPDASIVVRTPIVVPAGTVLLTIKLLIVIAMSLSALARIRFVLCDKWRARAATICRLTSHLRVDGRLTLSCLCGEYGLLQAAALAPGPKETQFGGALSNWLTRLNA